MQGIILVYDITNQQSFLHISKWASDVDEVRQEVFHLPVLYCDPVFQIRVVREYQSELQDTLFLCFFFFLCCHCLQCAPDKVQRMLIGNKCDEEPRRQVAKEQASKVRPFSSYNFVL